MAARYSARAYLGALKALLPPGRAWAAALGSVRERVLLAIGFGLERVDAQAVALLVDTFPATSDTLLPEWEASTGLPDPCAGPAPTLQQRQAQVVARVASTGGQSAAYFEGYAAQLGFPIKVETCAPFRVGQSRVGSPIASAAWVHAWIVHAPLTNLTKFRTGVSAVGEPLRAWGNAVLECELRARQPAHAILLFRYS